MPNYLTTYVLDWKCQNITTNQNLLTILGFQQNGAKQFVIKKSSSDYVFFLFSNSHFTWFSVPFVLYFFKSFHNNPVFPFDRSILSPEGFMKNIFTMCLTEAACRAIIQTTWQLIFHSISYDGIRIQLFIFIPGITVGYRVKLFKIWNWLYVLLIRLIGQVQEYYNN